MSNSQRAREVTGEGQGNEEELRPPPHPAPPSLGEQQSSKLLS